MTLADERTEENVSSGHRPGGDRVVDRPGRGLAHDALRERWFACSNALGWSVPSEWPDASVDEVCDRYGLSLEELAGWQRAVDRSCMAGLGVTRIQHYKSLYERQQKY